MPSFVTTAILEAIITTGGALIQQQTAIVVAIAPDVVFAYHLQVAM